MTFGMLHIYLERRIYGELESSRGRGECRMLLRPELLNFSSIQG